MILSTHAVVGGTIASFVPGHPVLAFVIGAASHFAIDAIPHVDYPLYSISIKRSLCTNAKLVVGSRSRLNYARCLRWPSNRALALRFAWGHHRCTRRRIGRDVARSLATIAQAMSVGTS